MKSYSIEPAINIICEKVKTLAQVTINEAELEFQARRLILMFLDYCHLKKVPEAFVLDAAAAMCKKLRYEAKLQESDTPPNLKALTQDDTKFEWSTVSLNEELADAVWDALKVNLLTYRKLVAW